MTVFAFGAPAADITGAWTADLETPKGKVPVHYSFRQQGEKLTGTWQAGQSPVIEISEGKVTGDKLSFSVVIEVEPTRKMVFAHEGSVKGDEIQLSMKPSGEFPGGTLVATRVKE